MKMNIVGSQTAEEVRESYRKEVEYVDERLGEVMARLRREGLLEDTLVVLTSDHGEGLGDHNLRGHVQQVYGSLMDAPLIMSHPGKLPRGKTIRNRVRHVDILPTIMDVLGVESYGATRGRSLLPLVNGEDSREHPVAGMTFKPEAGRNLASLIDGDLKIIHDIDADKYELYDLSRDPGELDNLATKEIVASNRMKIKLRKFLKSVNYSNKAISSRKATIDVDEKTMETLKGLGYAR